MLCAAQDSAALPYPEPMRRALLLVILAGLAGCTGVDVPCLPWDDGCTTAALFAEKQLGADWKAHAVSEVGCEEVAIRGFVDPGQCWRVQLRGRADEMADTIVVETTEGDLIFVKGT